MQKRIKLGDALEIRDGIIFDFYPGLPHMLFYYSHNLKKQSDPLKSTTQNNTSTTYEHAGNTFITPQVQRWQKTFVIGGGTIRVPAARG